ncbi:gamma-glutamyl-gamma-aminobutyrate hydrolase family protein [Bifidobacterium sp. CP2]|uniref:gamma-glutamyl-gamma-aminobutyrate hydrolase family protein n=1 Tax=Bifidobacterium sp. CP2 TaxID=2809025 RepID=UPI001BDC912E|nr:gamma-glutamyl-gamma-aminobutyrate hydrolase family protein [Bifidobacterium sp. CP2]MBT1180550.1 gamma-glutamyl-gamma-aminobutyrate hydrolase family protein [Bifidobacterium sp. CP2]
MKPVVALMMQYSETVPGAFDIDPGYPRMLKLAGADVLRVDPSDDDAYLMGMLDRADGLLIPGGNDIDPDLYGGKHLPGMDEPVPLRDHAEKTMLEAAYRRGMPYLGVCRGLQMMCVLAGGDLYQQIRDDVPGALDHWQRTPFSEPSHAVTLAEGTPINAIMGTDRLEVNSVHHQAVHHPGEGVVVQASAPDGIVESAYRPDRPFFMAVQWHPEQTPEAEPSRRLAGAFVEACRRYADGTAASE